MAAALLLACCTTTVAPEAPAQDSPALPQQISSQEGLPTGSLTIVDTGGAELLNLTVEIAQDPQSRQIGLMLVEDLPDDAGMAFLWDETHGGAFHMLNTLIPLDIAFWDPDGRIIDILHMQPCESELNCPLHRPQSDYVGAVELNAGLLRESGVRIGDEVTLTRHD